MVDQGVGKSEFLGETFGGISGLHSQRTCTSASLRVVLAIDSVDEVGTYWLWCLLDLWRNGRSASGWMGVVMGPCRLRPFSTILITWD